MFDVLIVNEREFGAGELQSWTLCFETINCVLAVAYTLVQIHCSVMLEAVNRIMSCVDNHRYVKPLIRQRRYSTGCEWIQSH